MKKDSSSSLPKISSNEIMTLAENLAFLAGFAEGISKGNVPTPETEVDADDELDALIADAELELPKDGWKPADRF